MIDNRMTELFELLEERGIEWNHGDAAYEIEWSTPDGRHCSATYWKPTFAILISGCTPEQAIIATLGEDEKLLDLAHHAWDIAVCSMQGMPIPASWGNAVEKGLRERGIDVDKLPYVVPDATLGDGEYEAKMDALLSRLTNGKWSKSRAYDLDFMESCINEEFENLHAKELADATLGNGMLTAEQVREAIEKRFVFDVWVPNERWQAIADELNAGRR